MITGGTKAGIKTNINGTAKKIQAAAVTGMT